MNVLVGSTGFVGSNLMAAGGIDRGFHSTDIRQAYGLKPDLLIYAGLPAEKYLANAGPEKDLDRIRQAEENILRIQPQKLVLISTVDVFQVPKGKDENSAVDTQGLSPYGLHRYQLEQWVRKYDIDSLIIRLPALSGKNLKKNFVYDMIHLVPHMLSPKKFEELAGKAPELQEYYALQENGFYCCRKLEEGEERRLREVFQHLGFTALNFTDSRSRFQFYPLSRLWSDIQTALANDLHLWHPATEPVSAAEIYRAVYGGEFVNHLSGTPADYDFRTVYDSLFGGSSGYICGKAEVLQELNEFISNQCSL